MARSKFTYRGYRAPVGNHKLVRKETTATHDGGEIDATPNASGASESNS